MPLTDEEIGIVPLTSGAYMPWDGVRGPTSRVVNGRPTAVYQDALRVDYLDIMGTMTAALTARIDQAEYQARILAMEAVYWALGIRAPASMEGEPAEHRVKAINNLIRRKADWAVLSFRVVGSDNSELREAERGSGHSLGSSLVYRFHVYRWGEHKNDPDDMYLVLVDMIEQAMAFVGGSTVLIRRNDGLWTADTSMPTS